MEIYVYAENCTRSGHVVSDVRKYMDDETGEVSPDICLWGDGQESDLVAQAIGELSCRTDLRPGGAGDSYRWRCARSVLELLDGPEIEFDPESMTWRVAP